MEKVLVSACLLGKKVRYDGKALSTSERILEQWVAAGKVISVCPEVDAGMTIPRSPAEILNGDGLDVWEGTARVIDINGLDESAYFKAGAHIALALCKKYQIRVAVLTENSPSCGSSAIYDGTFTNTKLDGTGVTVALLQKHGIEVFNQHDLDAANHALLRDRHYL
ncbi:DUF523 domain-containing protein [Pseudoalteromonas tunicata]|uniref:Uncharacterized protein n=1 Tax=Pseudoalteromonas tunicata D2 TaxID=87626 RepID=A4CFP7_9GAMM|nr:DUF523 domain-containing protein [Pseudoalteromonas tunicata]ATC94145.1 hypothetical protein PTUN_a1528 [Pseudoalteromonas tunicata]AXT29912.1 DUF523 domain-containing protein [Pseudoalteromonas tunicata]EAR26474.1 hypothetical protein PTD2_04786 [Pseudoalteromonas tunicata D2]